MKAMQLGLIIIDIVTDRKANLHNALLARLYATGVAPWDADFYTVAYRPVQRAGQPSLDMWQTAVAMGGPCPRCRCGCGAICACQSTWMRHTIVHVTSNG